MKSLCYILVANLIFGFCYSQAPTIVSHSIDSSIINPKTFTDLIGSDGKYAYILSGSTKSIAVVDFGGNVVDTIASPFIPSNPKAFVRRVVTFKGRVYCILFERAKKHTSVYYAAEIKEGKMLTAKRIFQCNGRSANYFIPVSSWQHGSMEEISFSSNDDFMVMGYVTNDRSKRTCKLHLLIFDSEFNTVRSTVINSSPNSLLYLADVAVGDDGSGFSSIRETIYGLDCIQNIGESKYSIVELGDTVLTHSITINSPYLFLKGKLSVKGENIYYAGPYFEKGNSAYSVSGAYLVMVKEGVGDAVINVHPFNTQARGAFVQDSTNNFGMFYPKRVLVHPDSSISLVLANSVNYNDVEPGLTYSTGCVAFRFDVNGSLLSQLIVRGHCRVQSAVFAQHLPSSVEMLSKGNDLVLITSTCDEPENGFVECEEHTDVVYISPSGEVDRQTVSRYQDNHFCFDGQSIVLSDGSVLFYCLKGGGRYIGIIRP